MMDPISLLQGWLPDRVLQHLGLALVFVMLWRLFRNWREVGSSRLVDEDFLLQARIFALAVLGASLFTAEATAQRVREAAVIVAVWLLLEAYVKAWLHFRILPRARLPHEFSETCFSVLVDRQDPESGGFRVRDGKSAPIQLWSSAQALHGIVTVAPDAAMAPAVRHALRYYSEKLFESETLWSDDEAALIAESSWVVMSLSALASSPQVSVLTEGELATIREWTNRGILGLVERQTHEGGWTPLGLRVDQDVRTLPTVAALWALVLALGARESLALSPDALGAAKRSMLKAVNLLKEQYREGDGFWDPNPMRGHKQRNSALSLLTYSVLLQAAALVRSNHSLSFDHGLNEVSRWLDGIHSIMLNHVQHCMHRDLSDNEVDDAFDNIVSVPTAGTRLVATTYYDWVSSIILVFDALRLHARFQLADAIMAQRFVSVLGGVSTKDIGHWYTFRLGVSLVGYRGEVRARASNQRLPEA